MFTGAHENVCLRHTSSLNLELHAPLDAKDTNENCWSGNVARVGSEVPSPEIFAGSRW